MAFFIYLTFDKKYNMRLLKQLTKFTLILLASLIAVFAVFGFFIDNTSSKWYAIILLALICLPMFYFGFKIKVEPKQPKIIKSFQTKKETPVKLQNNEPIKTQEKEVNISTTIVQKKFNERNSNFNYSSQMIKGKIFQVLESIEIIETTKNIDTLMSRYDFLLKIYDDIKIASSYSNYKIDFQKTIDEYKQMYYDKNPTQNQLIAIVKPLEFDLISFYYISCYRCFVRNCETQNKIIETLKTEKGKVGRYKKLLENLYVVKNIVENEILNNSDAKLIFDKLLEIESELKSKTI